MGPGSLLKDMPAEICAWGLCEQLDPGSDGSVKIKIKIINIKQREREIMLVSQNVLELKPTQQC